MALNLEDFAADLGNGRLVEGRDIVARLNTMHVLLHGAKCACGLAIEGDNFDFKLSWLDLKSVMSEAEGESGRFSVSSETGNLKWYDSKSEGTQSEEKRQPNTERSDEMLDAVRGVARLFQEPADVCPSRPAVTTPTRRGRATTPPWAVSPDRPCFSARNMGSSGRGRGRKMKAKNNQ